MPSTTVLYTDTDWQQSSGPILSRQLTEADIWPVGLASASDGSAKDVLENGMHPIVAVGPKANRAAGNLVGVVISYNANADLVQLNIAKGVVVRQYVSNIAGYAGAHTPNAWDASLAFGQPVYVDDSPDLPVGVTLSRSAANDLGAANPIAGYIWYAQDEFLDFGVGGPNVAAGLPKAASGIADENVLLCVLLK